MSNVQAMIDAGWRRTMVNKMEREQSHQLRFMRSKNTMFAYHNAHARICRREISSESIKKNSIILHANAFTQIRRHWQQKQNRKPITPKSVLMHAVVDAYSYAQRERMVYITQRNAYPNAHCQCGEYLKMWEKVCLALYVSPLFSSQYQKKQKPSPIW